MNRIGWLHLTDLHLGMETQAHLWPNVRGAFFDDLRTLHERTGPWSAVFFTGDLVFSGKAEEFQKLDAWLADLWSQFDRLGSRPVLYTVPGNHDLLRPNAKSSGVRLLAKWNENPEIHEEFWEDRNCEYRQIVDLALANYTNWWSKSELFGRRALAAGMLPGDFTDTLEVCDLKIGIVGLNTTFLQLTGDEFEGKLAWDQRQLHAATGGDGPAWLARHDISLLLTHQGPSWLSPHSRERAMGEIAPAGRFAVHLFGHLHEHTFREEGSGGGPTRRLWQGKSLYGLERYGSKAQSRSHGYSAATFEFDDAVRLVRFWPRAAKFDKQNGWRIARDDDSIKLEDDGGTRPLIIDTREAPFPPSPLLPPPPSILVNRSAEESAPVVGPKGEAAPSGRWGWPSQERELRPYCDAVNKIHSHLTFVEIPYLKDVSGVQLDNLYVEPRFSAEEVHADVEPWRWPRSMTAIDAVTQYKHLVLLGDPGSGKSTLVSYLSWQLCRQSPPPKNPWCVAFGGMLPLPIVLRELALKADLTWEKLLDAFLDHHIGKLLGSRADAEALLADGRALVLLDGLDETGSSSANEDADILLEYFARRSGLLLPRGEGRFAFMHLSLQEYFAACFIEPRLTCPRFGNTEITPEPSSEQLREWAGAPVWRETFILLFEMLSDKSIQQTEAFLQHLYAGRLPGDDPSLEQGSADLLAEVATDPFIKLTAASRQSAKRSCWLWAFRSDRHRRQLSGSARVVRLLVRDNRGHLVEAWKAAALSPAELRRAEHLDLSGCSDILSLTPIADLQGLQILNLAGSSISDLTPIAKLKKLRILNLDGCHSLKTLSGVAQLRHLETLFLGTPLELSPLSELRLLQELHLHYRNDQHFSEVDLTPVARINSLRHICLRGYDGPLRVSESKTEIRSPAIRELARRARGNLKSPRAQRQIAKGRSGTKSAQDIRSRTSRESGGP